MKSVDNEQRARRFAVGAACTSVIIGFIACSGASEHRATPHHAAGGDAAGGAAQAGAAATGLEQGGSQSAQAGQRTGGAPGVAGDVGVAGDSTGGVAGVATGGAAGESGGGVAGESAGGVGGESLGGAGGAGGAGGDAAFVDPVCGVNMVQVGAYSLWCGKVNMHTNSDGLWLNDADCSSGCNVVGVGYCQKFYPSATTVVSVPQLVTKDWKNAGCADSTPDGPGISGEAACCAPIP